MIIIDGLESLVTRYVVTGSGHAVLVPAVGATIQYGKNLKNTGLVISAEYERFGPQVTVFPVMGRAGGSPRVSGAVPHVLGQETPWLMNRDRDLEEAAKLWLIRVMCDSVARSRLVVAIPRGYYSSPSRDLAVSSACEDLHMVRDYTLEKSGEVVWRWAP